MNQRTSQSGKFNYNRAMREAIASGHRKWLTWEQEGKTAFRLGIHINPYSERTDARVAWQCGYNSEKEATSSP